ncbi:hypothetical protein [Jiulongibacter sp. NS-SX5]|uniref:hypothetical protein n=1 Tax=Jiulongibacter sp. NS-SX5 TaxID=3463854 RepID=UPI0040582D26
MKKLFTLLSLISISSFGQGESYFVKKDLSFFQEVEDIAFNFTSIDNTSETEESIERLKKQFDEGSKIAGSPFYGGGWFDGEFRLSGGKNMKGHMALDLHRNQLYVIESSSMSVLTLKPNWVKINGTEFTRLDHQIKGTGDYYYELIYNGSKKVYQRHQREFKNSRLAFTNGYEIIPQNRYDGGYMEKSVFLLSNEYRVLVIGDRDKFYRMFGRKAPKVKKYMIENSFDLSLKNDVLALVSSAESM